MLEWYNGDNMESINCQGIGGSETHRRLASIAGNSNCNAECTVTDPLTSIDSTVEELNLCVLYSSTVRTRYCRRQRGGRESVHSGRVLTQALCTMVRAPIATTHTQGRLLNGMSDRLLGGW